MNSAHRFEMVVATLVAQRCGPTARELDVARLAFIEGFTHAEIAESLTIAPGTVKAHLSHFAAKVGLSLRACRRDLPRVYWSWESGSPVNARVSQRGE